MPADAHSIKPIHKCYFLPTSPEQCTNRRNRNTAAAPSNNQNPSRCVATEEVKWLTVVLKNSWKS
jgi:hypothetical protein